MIKRGRGYACIHYGIGNAGRPNPASAFIELSEDGSCLVSCGAADLGQGSDTILCQLAAGTLGIPVENVTIMSADTRGTPEAGVSSASRQTYVSGNAVRLAAEKVRDILLTQAAEKLDCRIEDLVLSNNSVTHIANAAKSLTVPQVCQELRSRGVLAVGSGTFSPPTIDPLGPETAEGTSNGAFVFGTQMVEVEVDTETGEVRIVEVVACHDLGRCVNPMAAEGQIEGGVVMALGYGLMGRDPLERTRRDAHCRTGHLPHTYLLGRTAYHASHRGGSGCPSGPYGAEGHR